MTEIIKYKEDPEELDNYIVALQDPNSKFSQSVGARHIPTLLGRAIGYRDAYDRNLVAEAKRKDEDGKKALGDFKKILKVVFLFQHRGLVSYLLRLKARHLKVSSTE